MEDRNGGSSVLSWLVVFESVDLTIDFSPDCMLNDMELEYDIKRFYFVDDHQS